MQMQTLAITVAYMIYDLVCCLFDKKVNLDNMAHHLVSIVGLGAGLAYEKVLFVLECQQQSFIYHVKLKFIWHVSLVGVLLFNLFHGILLILYYICSADQSW